MQHAQEAPDAGAAETLDAAPAALTVAVGSNTLGAVDAPPPSANLGSFRMGVVIYGFEKRSRTMAKALAEKALETARTDFGAAVKAADPESDADYGTFAPHSFEAEVEAAIVAIPPGQVGGPIETPRGFWVVKRIK